MSSEKNYKKSTKKKPNLYVNPPPYQKMVVAEAEAKAEAVAVAVRSSG